MPSSRHSGSRGKGSRGGKKKAFLQPSANFGRDIAPGKVASALRNARLQLHRKGNDSVTVENVLLAVLDHFGCENERQLVARIQIDHTTTSKNKRAVEVVGVHDFPECVCAGWLLRLLPLTMWAACLLLVLRLD